MKIEDVQPIQERHQQELLALPGVIGVSIGALDDGRLCIKVLVLQKTPELRKKIPSSLEGCPVVLEVTDEIRPMGKAKD